MGDRSWIDENDVRGYWEDANVELLQHGLVERLLTKYGVQIAVHVLGLGSFNDIPAQAQHQVEWTTPNEPTI
jgi:hypothetical protein